MKHIQEIYLLKVIRIMTNAEAVIYGMPMDWTVSFRPGSRFGPARIREVSIGLEEYSPYLDRELEEVKFLMQGIFHCHSEIHKEVLI